MNFLDVWQERMSDNLLKIHIPGLGVIHQFTGEDHGDFHDHPWPFTTIICKGGYVEEVLHDDGTTSFVEHNRFEWTRIEAKHRHRVIKLPTSECWTCIDALWQEMTQPVHFYRFMDGRMWKKPAKGEDPRWVPA